MNKAALDTDTLSAVMELRPEATSALRVYRSMHPATTISIITRFEILRGLFAKNATAKIARFERFCESMEVLPVDDDIIVRAARIHGELRVHPAEAYLAGKPTILRTRKPPLGLDKRGPPLPPFSIASSPKRQGEGRCDGEGGRGSPHPLSTVS